MTKEVVNLFPARQNPTETAGRGRKKTTVAADHLRAGDLCPRCQVERMDYDGLLNLSCPRCGTMEGAWGGCS